MTQYEDEIENMMPIDCLKCGDIFDLNDGYGSEKWFPNKTICSACHDLEEKEIEADERIEELEDLINDAKITIRESVAELGELGIKRNITIVES